jgi:hypothetical protein
MEDDRAADIIQPAGDDDKRLDQWHLQKSIPISLLFAIAIQTCAIIWWAAKTEQRVSDLEIRQAAAANQPERLARVEEKIDNANKALADIKTYLRTQKAGLP